MAKKQKFDRSGEPVNLLEDPTFRENAITEALAAAKHLPRDEDYVDEILEAVADVAASPHTPDEQRHRAALAAVEVLTAKEGREMDRVILEEDRPMDGKAATLMQTWRELRKVSEDNMHLMDDVLREAIPDERTAQRVVNEMTETGRRNGTDDPEMDRIAFALALRIILLFNLTF